MAQVTGAKNNQNLLIISRDTLFLFSLKTGGLEGEGGRDKEGGWKGGWRGAAKPSCFCLYQFKIGPFNVIFHLRIVIQIYYVFFHFFDLFNLINNVFDTDNSIFSSSVNSYFKD